MSAAADHSARVPQQDVAGGRFKESSHVEIELQSFAAGRFV